MLLGMVGRGLHNGHACHHGDNAANDGAAEDLAQPRALHRAHEGNDQQLRYLQHMVSPSDGPHTIWCMPEQALRRQRTVSMAPGLGRCH